MATGRCKFRLHWRALLMLTVRLADTLSMAKSPSKHAGLPLKRHVILRSHSLVLFSLSFHCRWFLSSFSIDHTSRCFPWRRIP
jgi:hypothetical protein